MIDGAKVGIPGDVFGSKLTCSREKASHKNS